MTVPGTTVFGAPRKKMYDPTMISRPSSELIRLSMMNGRLWDKTFAKRYYHQLENDDTPNDDM